MVLKERKERFATLPFSVGLVCVSQSSVAVIENQPKARHETNSTSEDGGGRGDQSQFSGRTKSSSGFLQLTRPNISSGLHRLVNGLKRLSNLFTFYKDYDEEEEEVEMEIGYPTDVQHVNHIGWDGMKSYEKSPEFFPLSSLPLKQFELAMASQAEFNAN